MVVLALVAVMVFVIGIWFGTQSDGSNTSTTTTVTQPSPASAGAQGSEPDPLSLAAISLATVPGEPASTLTGSEALAAILAEPAKERAEAAQRSAYWSAVGVTIGALREMEATAFRLKNADDLKQNQPLLQAVQARALFAVGGLEQMRVATNQTELMRSLRKGTAGAVDESIAQANRALGAEDGKAANKAARQLSRSALDVDGTLAVIQDRYGKALKTASLGAYASADDLLGQLRKSAAQLP